MIIKQRNRAEFYCSRARANNNPEQKGRKSKQNRRKEKRADESRNQMDHNPVTNKVLQVYEEKKKERNGPGGGKKGKGVKKEDPVHMLPAAAAATITATAPE